MNAECQAAVNALVVTGMDPVEAERKVLALYQLFPAATGVELTLMILSNVRPVSGFGIDVARAGDELRDLAHLYGAGSFGQQLKQNVRKGAADSVAMIFGVVIWVVIAFLVIFVLTYVIPVWGVQHHLW